MSFGRLTTLGVLFVSVTLLGLFGYRILGSGSGSRFDPKGGNVNTLGRAANFKPRPASEFTLTTFGGEEVRLRDLRGKVVLLNFWASWCTPCKDEAEVLARSAREYEGEDVVFLGVNTWDEEGDAKEFLSEYGVTYANGTTRGDQLAIEYGVLGIPETFVIDAGGTVVSRWLGPVKDDQLAALVDAGLASEQPASAGR